MRIAVHAGAAKRGGVVTYFLNLLPHLEKRHAARHSLLLFAPEEHVARFRAVAPSADVRACPASGGLVARRLAWDNVVLPKILRRERCDVLLSLNFPVAAPPCPQAVWFRNARYFSKPFIAELRRQRKFGEYLDSTARRLLVRMTLRWADMTLFPTAAFRDEVRERWPRLPPSRVLAYAPGDPADGAACPADVLERMRRAAVPGKTLVFPSLPGVHKNLETVFRALEIVVQEENNAVLLLPSFPGWEPDIPAALRSHVALFSPLPRACMPELYCLADVVLFPSLCESFGLPLVEAMADGKAVLASDMPTNREICGDAARYYSPIFDAGAMAREILALLCAEGARRALGEKGRARAAAFSWQTHADGLVAALEAAAGVDTAR